MPSKVRLISLFLISLLVFAIHQLPASLVLSRLDGTLLGGRPLALKAVSGRIWQGRVQWQWQQLAGVSSWQMDWHGMMPGVQIESVGAFSLSGWLGASFSSLSLQGASLSLPGETISQVEPRLQMAGVVSARELGLHFSDKAITDAGGTLAYTGGDASWSRQAMVSVPALKGRLSPEPDGASLVITGDSGQQMAVGAIHDNVGEFKVFRAWAAAFGMSQGGSIDDVIFETSLPLWSK